MSSIENGQETRGLATTCNKRCVRLLDISDKLFYFRSFSPLFPFERLHSLPLWFIFLYWSFMCWGSRLCLYMCKGRPAIWGAKILFYGV